MPKCMGRGMSPRRPGGMAAHLIEHEVLPSLLLEGTAVLHGHVVGGHAHVERIALGPALGGGGREREMGASTMYITGHFLW